MAPLSAGRALGQREGGGSTWQGGFTLLQVLAALSLAAMLVGVSVPVFSAILQAYGLNGAAREVFGQLQRARMTAVTENNRYLFRVDNSLTYSILADKNRDRIFQDPAEVVLVRDIRKENPGASLTGTGPILFVPDGTAPPAGGTITVTGNGLSKQIQVSAGGRIRIQ